MIHQAGLDFELLLIWRIQRPAGQLGHIAIDVTVDTYGHLMPNASAELQAALERSSTAGYV